MKNCVNQNNYYRGVFFLLLMMMISCSNDIITKFMGVRLDPFEIAFFRFFFTVITLLPFIISRGKSIFRTNMLRVNIIRGILGFIGFMAFIYSIVNVRLVEVIAILWTIPLFILVLSKIFLKEHVTYVRWLATIIGFLGLSIITLLDHDGNFSFKLLYIVPVISAFVFAVQDVMIKRMIESEDRINMMFYFAIITTVLSFVPALFVWKTPTLFELSMLFLIGASANLMQYFIFKAFEATDLSALSPYRYVEFIFSAFFGFLFFSELPGKNVFIGTLILIPCTIYLGWSERKNAKFLQLPASS